MFSASEVTQIARAANCGRQAVIDYFQGARRTTPALAAAIDAAAARLRERTTILAVNSPALEGVSPRLSESERARADAEQFASSLIRLINRVADETGRSVDEVASVVGRALKEIGENGK